MDARFRPVYARLYWNYPTLDAASRLFPVTESPWDFAEFLVGRIEAMQLRREAAGSALLREDAKYLLLTVFTQMIYMPMALASRKDGARSYDLADIGEIRQLIAADLETLTQAAAEDEERLITAHAILNALPKIWRELRTGETRLWETYQENQVEINTPQRL
jgi:hypothetical protein